MKHSGRFASTAVIFFSRAERLLSTFVQRGNSRPGFLDRVGKGGAGFDFRFSFCPSARCAFRDGEGPRALGFSIRQLYRGRAERESIRRLRCIGGIRSFG